MHIKILKVHITLLYKEQFASLYIGGRFYTDGLPSMGSHRVGHDWSDFAAAAAAEDDSVVKRICVTMQKMQEMQVPSLGQSDHLEKEMATHSSVFACKIPCTENPGGLQSRGLQRVRQDSATEHAHGNEL